MGSYYSGHTQYISINNEDNILKNKNIRKALSYSLDRKTLVEEIVGNSSKEAYAFVNPIVRGLMVHLEEVREIYLGIMMGKRQRVS